MWKNWRLDLCLCAYYCYQWYIWTKASQKQLLLKKKKHFLNNIIVIKNEHQHPDEQYFVHQLAKFNKACDILGVWQKRRKEQAGSKTHCVNKSKYNLVEMHIGHAMFHPFLEKIHTCDETGNQQRQNQHLEHSHQQFSRKGEELDVSIRHVITPQAKPQDYACSEHEMWSKETQNFIRMFHSVPLFCLLTWKDLETWH